MADAVYTGRAMANLTTHCPACRKKLKLPNLDAVGKKTRCPNCKETIVVPPPAAASPAKPTAKPAAAPAKPASATPKPTAKASSSPTAAPPAAPAIPFGLEARWVPDEAAAVAPAATASPAASTIAVEDEPVGVSPAAAIADAIAPVDQPAAKPDPTDTIHTDAPATPTARGGRRASRRRSNGLAKSAMAAAAVLAVAAGAYFLWPQPSAIAGPEATAPAPAAVAVADAAAAVPSVRIESPTRGEPVDAVLMPDGVSILTHIRPAELWSPQAASVREAFPPGLLDRVRDAIEGPSRHPVAAIREATFGYVLGGRGSEPQQTLVVRLTNEIDLGPFIQKVGGEAKDLGGNRRQITIGEEAIIIRDLTTLAIGPAALVDEMQSAADRSNTFLKPTLTNLLPKTDRQRLFTVAASRNDLDIHGAALLGDDGGALLTDVIDVFGRDCDGVAASFHQGQTSYLELLGDPIRNTTVGQSQAAAIERWNALPQSLMDSLRTTRPSADIRSFVGRVPAMVQAANLASEIDAPGGLLRLRVLLPAKAAPNFVAATFVTYNVLHAPRDAAPAVNAAPVAVASLTDRLSQPVEASFSRVPLQEALQFLADEAKATLEIDGDALKAAGYTKNMAQQFDLGTVPIRDVFGQIAAQYDQMAVVFDEPANRIVVLTKDFAAQRNLTPATFSN